jgi:trimethylamine monooxygenase
MADKLRLVTTNRLYPSNLYKGIFWQTQPRLMYLGMQDLALTLTMFEAQSYYARDFILGRLILPKTEEERQVDIAKWQEREQVTNECVDICKFQVDYVEELINATDCSKLDMEGIMTIFKGWIRDREDIATMRDQSYASTITGTMAAPQQSEI